MHLFQSHVCGGITWCAMAWVQYQQPDKLIFNESTFKKLNAYLDMDFLKKYTGLSGAVNILENDTKGEILWRKKKLQSYL